MPYHDKKQQPAPEENKKARPEEQFDSKQRSFGMPNSLMQAVPMTSPGTPNSVMREMNADDSGVLFRGRGFDPALGVHESSHTVRREPTHGPVSLTVPSGTIQRNPEDDEDDEDDDGFRRISGGDITDDQIEQDIALWAQKLHSKEGGSKAAGKEARKNAKAAAKNRKATEDFYAAMAAAQGDAGEEQEEKEQRNKAKLSPREEQKAFNRGSGVDVADSRKVNVGGIAAGLEKDSIVQGQESMRDKVARKVAGIINYILYKEE